MRQDNMPEGQITIRPRAIADIESCADYLEANASPETVSRFRISIMKAVEQIAAMPGTGSPRHVLNPRLSGLRLYTIPGFKNYLFFYLTSSGGAEIIRLFHGAQDVNSILEVED